MSKGANIYYMQKLLAITVMQTHTKLTTVYIQFCKLTANKKETSIRDGEKHSLGVVGLFFWKAFANMEQLFSRSSSSGLGRSGNAASRLLISSDRLSPPAGKTLQIDYCSPNQNFKNQVISLKFNLQVSLGNACAAHAKIFGGYCACFDNTGSWNPQYSSFCMGPNGKFN